METFYGPVKGLAEIEKIIKTLENPGRPVMISGCIDSQKAHFINAADVPGKFRVILTYDEVRARQLADSCRFYNQDACYYPAKDFIFYSADMHGGEIVGQRLRVIWKILEWQREEKERPLVVVTTMDGCEDLLLPLERLSQAVFSLEEGEALEMEAFKKTMLRLGYEQMGMVEAPGQFAVRGGILDVFPHTEEVPVRIELWGDEVDSIRSFDLESQRSLERLERISIFPAREWVFAPKEKEEGEEALRREFALQEKRLKQEMKGEAARHLQEAAKRFEISPDYGKYIKSFSKHQVSFLEYFPVKDTLFVLDEPNRLKERAELTAFEFEDSCKNRLEGGYILPSQAGLLLGEAHLYGLLEKRRVLALSTLQYKPRMMTVSLFCHMEVRGINAYNNQFEMLVDDLRRYKKNGFRAVLISGSKSRAMRLAQDLREYQLDSFFSDDYDKEVLPGQIMVAAGSLIAGFEYPLVKFVVITESDIFGQRNKPKKKRKKYGGKAISGFQELAAGDYVVHENHGLGIYRGIEKITVDDAEKDYIKVEYDGGGNLYILATQLEMLQKYAGQDAAAPRLNKLGSQEWHRTKSRVSHAVEAIARDLVELYAKRQLHSGYQYGGDTVWQREFEELFPYEETQDQTAAIEDTKRDMESAKIMDRLICGDVGFGKTEIAIRAAFKAVQESKQVACLVPTTILAQQHYNTFVQRMKNFPVTIAMLSRFRTAKENRETVEKLKKGLIDVVIGTHRLLSKDVDYKDLGLLVVDEEQRFGVTHKEKIKKLKENVDVLTLSATPIPRTLHMSLAGIRDMSVLEEPPTDRMPIQTFVTEQNDEIVREAIRRELGRKGQVYYVCNRVKNIDETAAAIQALVPEAGVVYAHGQMDERLLERIMLDFINGDIDVLVSTTIIETGLDISNVNTIIIQDADKFGLSQLYQLRGRVGRSNRTAYAFLLYKRDRLLRETAEKRLQAIREFTDLGSGFRIAMKDLEIRGAGNVLGESQHGHMAAVGYDLYCKMLNEAVCRLKGEDVAAAFETCVDLPVDAYIPDSYIKSEIQKLDVYKRIAGIESEEEKMDMEDELTDRYGELPDSASNLLNIALLKARAHKAGVMEIKGEAGGAASGRGYRTILRMYPECASVRVEKIPEFVGRYREMMKFTVEKAPFFTYVQDKKETGGQGGYISGLLEVVDAMCNILS